MQWHLILIGKIPKPWTETGTFTFSDAYGNETTLPTVAALSMVFSALSMLKALVSFNILNVHICNVDSSKKLIRLISIVMNHLAYFVSTVAFRVGSITLLYSYLNEYALVPVALFWLLNLSYGYQKLVGSGAPYWLISFSAIFFPIYFIDFTNRKRNTVKIQNQYWAFKFQSMASLVIFGLSLGVSLFFVNVDDQWCYSSTTILDNVGFNVVMVTCIITGIISAAMSFEPNVFEAANKLFRFLTEKRLVLKIDVIRFNGCPPNISFSLQ